MLKEVSTEPQKGRLRTIFYWLAGLLVLTFTSFQYLFITKFPIGDDPAVHISTIKNSSYKELLSLNYPIPEIIFKFFHQILNADYPILFVVLICVFLFLGSVAMYFLVRKVSNSWLIGLIAAITFATGRWTVDGLRMGLLPETFGWFVLLLLLNFLIRKKYFMTIILSILIVFSHPFSTFIYSLVFLAIFLFVILGKDKGDKKFILSVSLTYLVAALLVYFLDKQLISRFLGFVNPEAVGWGERSIWSVLVEDQVRRFYVVMLALVGLVISAKKWSAISTKVVYGLFFAGLYMSFNQLFGIRLLVFRFFPYLEMGMSIFFAIGLVYVLDKYILDRKKLAISAFIVGSILVFPQYFANYRMTTSQAHDYRVDSSMSEDDRLAIQWVEVNVETNKLVAAPHKRAIWLLALTDKKVLDAAFIDNSSLIDASVLNYCDYFYYPENISAPLLIVAGTNLVYNQGGVKIYEVKR